MSVYLTKDKIVKPEDYFSRSLWTLIFLSKRMMDNYTWYVLVKREARPDRGEENPMYASFLYNGTGPAIGWGEYSPGDIDKALAVFNKRAGTKVSLEELKGV